MGIEERKALEKQYKNSGRAIWVMVLVFIFSLVGIGVIGGTSFIAHTLGMTTPREATVTGKETVDWCTKRNRDLYTMTWTEEGEQTTAKVGRCGDPWEIWDKLQVWTWHGEILVDSPAIARATLIGFVLLYGLATWWVWSMVRRMRKNIGSALNGTWQPEQYASYGVPATPGFQIDAPVPYKFTRLEAMRPPLYTQGACGPEDYGTIYVSELNKGKPKGLSLHVSQNSKTWRWS